MCGKPDRHRTVTTKTSRDDYTQTQKNHSDEISLEDIMNKTENLSVFGNKTILIFEKTIKNFFRAAANLLMKIFRVHNKPNSCLLLPSGTEDLPENRPGSDFYSMPVRICKKSL